MSTEYFKSGGIAKRFAQARIAADKRNAQPQPHNPFTKQAPPGMEGPVEYADPSETQDEPEFSGGLPSSMDGGELLQMFLEQNNLFHFEMNTDSLERVVEGIGYNSLEEFLGDNPGAQEAIVSWIESYVNKVPEWKTQLEGKVDTGGLE